MESDRELLELAAKAAGRIVGTDEQCDPIGRKYTDVLGLWCAEPWDGWFNPLNNDGDAFRLAVKLDMDIQITGGKCVYACAVYGNCSEQVGDNKLGATRRVIVRAAAEIGRRMKDADKEMK